MRIKTQSKSKMKLGIGIIVSLAVLGVGVYFYMHRNDGEIKRDKNGISVEETPQDRKLQQDLQTSPEKKQETSQTDKPATPTIDQSTHLQQVNVVLTNSGETNGTVSASGFVSNAVEADGVCRYSFTNGQKVVEKTSTTLQNATSTTCKTVQFSASELSAGTWKVQLKYSSSTSTGASNVLDVVVS